MPPAAGRSWPSGSAGRSARLWVSLGVGYALPQDGEGDTSGRQYGPAPRCLGRNVGPAHVQHVGRCAATDSEVYAHREIAEPWARHVHTAAASGNPGRPAWPSGRPVPGGAPEGALRSGQDPEAGPGFLAVGCISRGWDALCPSTGHILGGVWPMNLPPLRRPRVRACRILHRLRRRARVVDSRKWRDPIRRRISGPEIRRHPVRVL